jgi:hypothetical protein
VNFRASLLKTDMTADQAAGGGGFASLGGIDAGVRRGFAAFVQMEKS